MELGEQDCAIGSAHKVATFERLALPYIVQFTLVFKWLSLSLPLSSLSLQLSSLSLSLDDSILAREGCLRDLERTRDTECKVWPIIPAMAP